MGIASKARCPPRAEITGWLKAGRFGEAPTVILAAELGRNRPRPSSSRPHSDISDTPVGTAPDLPRNRFRVRSSADRTTTRSCRRAPPFPASSNTPTLRASPCSPPRRRRSAPDRIRSPSGSGGGRACWPARASGRPGLRGCSATWPSSGRRERGRDRAPQGRPRPGHAGRAGPRPGGGVGRHRRLRRDGRLDRASPPRSGSATACAGTNRRSTSSTRWRTTSARR